MPESLNFPATVFQVLGFVDVRQVASFSIAACRSACCSGVNCMRPPPTDGALARKQVDEAQVAYAQANAQLETAQEHLKALQGVARDEQLKTAEAQVASAKAHSQTSDAQLDRK